jgi:hypothetical protein
MCLAIHHHHHGRSPSHCQLSSSRARPPRPVVAVGATGTAEPPPPPPPDDRSSSRRPALFIHDGCAQQSIKDAVRHVADAQRMFERRSSRIEYCRAQGVDYDSVVKYAGILESLKRTTDDPQSVIRVVATPPGLPNGEGKVVIMIGNREVSREWPDNTDEPCPICLKGWHKLRHCPVLPDELRPFVDHS